MTENEMSLLFEVIRQRKNEPQEGSYTCYLFDQGIDKICKKVGEESAETIIAAKNGNKTDLCGEICDLIYHVSVLAVEQGLDWAEIEAVLAERSRKIGNLKQFHQTDKNT